MKLLIAYKGRTNVLRTIQQARQFKAELDKGEVVVEVLKHVPEKSRLQSHRRESVIYRVWGRKFQVDRFQRYVSK